MAIVNRTPDSFFDRGATFAEDAALAAVDAAVAEGADIVDIGGVKAGPGDDGRRGRGDPPDRADRRRGPGGLPGPGDQRRHLAGRGRPGGRAGPAPTCSTTPGPAPTRRWPRWPRRPARAWSARTPAAWHPRTRPHRVAYDDVVADVVATVTGARRAGGRPGRTPRRHPDRPGARLRQEHPALAGDHPAAGRAGGDRLAGAGGAVQQGLRRRDPGRAAGAAAGRDAGHDRGLGLAGRPGVPGAPRRARPGRCSTWSRDPGRPAARPAVRGLA